ncbi:MAG: aromatic amino acid DMT transporter YddG [Phycisphaeraceae bacterium]|nr:aromatic amino acid DMT transporter YddG [Phycisphaeraceae bacterium]
MVASHTGHRSATLLGILAIVLWSTSFPVYTRVLNPAIGGLRAGAISFTLAGLVGIMLFVFRHRGLGPLRDMSRAYLLVSGGIFVVFAVAMFLAIDLSRGAYQSIEITLINYLWIPLIFAFSLPILKQKAKWTLGPGLLLAFVGVFLTTTRGRFSVTEFMDHLRENPWPYGLAMTNAISWALYTVTSRRFNGGKRGDALPLFMLASGLVLLPISFLLPSRAAWSPTVVASFAYAALFPGLIAYSLWDLAARRGDLHLLAAASYATPLLATLFNCILFGKPLTWHLIFACALVILGAAMCRWSVRDTSAPQPALLTTDGPAASPVVIPVCDAAAMPDAARIQSGR